MKLQDLRKLTVKKQLKVRFRLKNGMECIINEQGIAEVPGLKKAPDFNLDEELASAAEFVVSPAKELDKKNPSKPQTLAAAEMAAMASASPAAAAGAHDEDE
jgi:hypothetical protein